jgi:hypothetical protein
VEWRAYWGYQRRDSPALLGTTIGYGVTDGVELVAVANRGLTSDAPPWGLRLGVLLRVPLSRTSSGPNPPGA